MVGVHVISAPAPTRPAAALGRHLPARPVARATTRQRRPAPRRPRASAAGGAPPEPDDARSAIALGRALCDAGRYAEAQALFERALELPGTGIKRFRDRPRGLSAGEKIAALYNCACTQARLGGVDNALLALAGALEAGFDDLATARSDPDLEALRGDPRFEGLLARFDRGGGMLAGLFKR